MGDWQGAEEEDCWQTFFDCDVPEDESLFPYFVRLFSEESKWRKKKKKSDADVEESYYNISVYKILPYPPNTKDPKEFFIQKT
ncbi:MAG: hypothetical protein JW840_00935 [Candidatus Thermoplasmatota archaeon]|nr:hypothetical protein [Candidatus Thermoplasmatota archaeon]